MLRPSTLALAAARGRRAHADFPATLLAAAAARTNTALENMSWVVKDVVEVLNGRPAKYPAPKV